MSALTIYHTYLRLSSIFLKKISIFFILTSIREIEKVKKLKTAQNWALAAEKREYGIHLKGEKSYAKRVFSGTMAVTSRKGLNEKMAHQKIIYQLTDKRIPAASGIGMIP